MWTLSRFPVRNHFLMMAIFDTWLPFLIASCHRWNFGDTTLTNSGFEERLVLISKKFGKLLKKKSHKNLHFHLMPVKIAASSKTLQNWHGFYRLPLPNVHNSPTRNVRDMRLKRAEYWTMKPGNKVFWEPTVCAVVFGEVRAYCWRNTRIVRSALLPRLAYYRTGYVAVVC